MSDNLKKVRQLLDNSMAYIGMIAEIQMRCRLLKSRVCSNDPPPPGEITQAISQMKEDLAKYSEYLDDIYKELEGYGIVSKLE